MKSILVLGRTRFFGKKLVNKLIEEGHAVTLATRGHNKIDPSLPVKQLTIERTDRNSLRAALTGKSFDMVYDQICYSSLDAMDSCEVMEGHVGKYIFTSTQAVYDHSDEASTEECFDPSTHAIVTGRRQAFSYPEGKRQAEAVFAQHAVFPVISIRFPFVLGIDDYTNRLIEYRDKIKSGETLYVQNMDAKLSLISSDEAAEVLNMAKQLDAGVYNAASIGSASNRDIIHLMEKYLSKKGKVANEIPTGYDWAPYSVPGSWLMDCTNLLRQGFELGELHDWLTILVEKINIYET